MTTTPSRPPQTEAPRAFAALRHSGYSVYLLGSAMAMGADSIEHVISYWMIFEKFHSPALAGYAVISHWLPFLLFSIYSGALADRFDPRRIIQIGMVLFMLCSLAWGILFITDTLAVWHTVVILAVHGIAGVLWAPASQLSDSRHRRAREALQCRAPDGDIAHARPTGRSRHRRRAAARARPVARHPGQRAVLCAARVVAMASAVWSGVSERAGIGAGTRRVGGFADVAATARDIAGNHILVSMTLVAGATSLLVGNAYQPQMPEFASDLGQGDVGVYYSMLLAANAAGALIAGILLETWGLMHGRPRIAFMLAIAWCLCMLGFAVSRIYLLVSRCCCLPPDSSIWPSARCRRRWCSCTRPTPSADACSGSTTWPPMASRAFSGVTVGMLGSLIGIHWSLGLSALTLLAVTLALDRLRPTRRRGATGRVNVASPGAEIGQSGSNPIIRAHSSGRSGMFSKINHVAIVSENYAQLAQFYQAVFGMTTSDKTRPGRAVTVRDGYVGLNINPRRAGRSAGLDHFGIQVEDCETAFERMRKKYPTVKWLKRPATRPFAGISTHDPDGNMFDISQKDMTNRTSVYVENDGKTNARHINHVALRTMNPDAMAEFYRDVFELAPSNVKKSADDRNHYLTDGHMTLVVMPWDIMDYDGTGIITMGMDHIGFKVESVDALKADVERIAGDNPRLSPAPINTGKEGAALDKLFERSCAMGQHRLADPDGILIDVMAD